MHLMPLAKREQQQPQQRHAKKMPPLRTALMNHSWKKRGGLHGFNNLQARFSGTYTKSLTFSARKNGHFT